MYLSSLISNSKTIIFDDILGREYFFFSFIKQSHLATKVWFKLKTFSQKLSLKHFFRFASPCYSKKRFQSG